MDDLICVYDFAGNSRDCGFWADWSKSAKTVYFGGDWWDVPDMQSETIPSEKEVFEWAKNHGWS
jgi:hypothetical protein